MAAPSGLTRFTTTPLRGTPPGVSPRASGAASRIGRRACTPPMSLRLGDADARRADGHGLGRPLLGRAVGVVGFRKYSTGHVQPRAGRLAEDGVMPVHRRRLGEVNIELAR